MGFLSPISVMYGAMVPSHLLYADDILLFCHASTRNCRILNKIFLDYAAVSSQLVWEITSFSSSFFFFGKAISLVRK